MDTLYAEQGAPYCVRESRGMNMRRENAERKKKKKKRGGTERCREVREGARARVRKRERNWERATVSDEEGVQEKQKE